MTYAKLISERMVDTSPPRRANINGRLVTGELPADYLASVGYYPFYKTEAPVPQEGFHMEERYEISDGRIVQSWVEVEDPPSPPRSFSKRKLYDALNSRGLWEQTQSYLESTGKWMTFSLATTLDEDDSFMAGAISALKTAFGLTDEQLEEILSESVSEQ